MFLNASKKVLQNILLLLRTFFHINLNLTCFWNHLHYHLLTCLFSFLMLENIVSGINLFVYLHPHCGTASQEPSGRHVHYLVSKNFWSLTSIRHIDPVFASDRHIGIFAYSWHFDHVGKAPYKFCLYTCIPFKFVFDESPWSLHTVRFVYPV